MNLPLDNTQRFINITPNDLPLHCPMPGMLTWNMHPRVYMPIEATGEALCPYCGTRYRLNSNENEPSHSII